MRRGASCGSGDPSLSLFGLLRRYAKEVSGLREVVANDVDPVAHQTMASNFGRNGLLEGGGEQSCRVTSTVGDAAALLYASRPPAGERFDVVDLDPYGTASPFLDGAVQAVSEGGLLMVTCTDMAVLAGAYPEAGAEVGRSATPRALVRDAPAACPSTGVLREVRRVAAEGCALLPERLRPRCGARLPEVSRG